MERFLIQLSILILISNLCLGQSINSNDMKPNSGATSSCHGSYENKSIGICSNKTDTLTILQLKGCSRLSVDNDNKKVITSFRLWYKPNDTTMAMKSISGDQIPKDIINKIIALGIKKIMVDEVFGVEGKTNLNLGSRWFYLKFW